jgi:PmbA protein
VEELVERVLRAGKRVGEIEVRLGVVKRKRVEFEREEIRSASSSQTSILELRLTLGKKFGYSSTMNLRDWKRCLEDATKMARVGREFDFPLTLPSKQRYPKIKQERIEVEIDDLIQFGEAAIDGAKEFKGIDVQSCSLSKARANEFFANSNGIYASQSAEFISCKVWVRSASSTGWEMRNSRKLDIDFAEVGRDAAELCLSSMNPKLARTQRVEVLLDYFSLSSLIGLLLIPALCADRVQLGRSLLAGKIGKQISSEELSLVDDGRARDYLMSSRFDAEGVATQRKVLLEKGLLNQFLYDHHTASKEGKGSTGNCLSLAKRPSVGPSNFIISPGDWREEEMIRETKRGILVKFLTGIHTANEVSGDFSVGIENAFMIENGRMAYPIKGGMISGNIFNLLRNIEGIGKKIRQEGNVASPRIKFSEVQFIG